MDPVFSGGIGFFRVDGPLPADSPSALQLELTSTHAPVLGEPLSLRVRMLNRGESPIVVMRALDGSREHWRTVHWDLYLRDEVSGDIYAWDVHGARCGNVNSIGEEDYVTIDAGQYKDDVPGPWASHLQDARISRSGHYSVWVTYRICAGPEQGLGTNERRSDVREGVYTSNHLPIHLAEAGQ